jgi:NAD(P)-dependent dehydrogenase (short-subunit alcohol dehydrogenase family)
VLARQSPNTRPAVIAATIWRSCAPSCSGQQKSAGQVAFHGAVAYKASKHGVLGLTKVVANEYVAHGVRCNAVGSGVVQTQMLEDSFCHRLTDEKSVERIFV